MVEFYPLSITGNRKPRVIVSRIQQRFKAFSHILGNWRSISFTVLLLLFYMAASAQFSLNETFKGSSVGSNIVLGGAPVAVLTSGGVDPANDGWLRLTNTSESQKGSIYINTPFPSTLGISIDFEYKTWRDITDGFGGADGLSLFLFDGSVPFQIGAYGGSLGYAGDGVTTEGMAGGYLGIGFDEFGSYSASGAGRAGGTTTLRPNSVVLRGPTTNDATTTSPYLTGVTLTNNGVSNNTVIGSGLEDEVDYNSVTATRPTDAQFYRRVHVDIVPSGGQYIVTVKWTKTPNGAFTTLLTYTTTIPPPATLKVGFAASTGRGINYHEIRNLRVTTPGGVSADKAVNKANAQVGDIVTYTVNAYNSTTAAINGLILTDALKTNTDAALPPSNFTTQSITFNNNANAANTAAGYVSGIPKTTGLTNPFSATLNMAANSKSTFTVTGVVNAVPTGGIIRNTVTVDPTNTGITDQDLTNNTFSVNTNVFTPPNVDLQLTGTVGTSCFLAGNPNFYTFNVTNLGPAATGGILPTTVNITVPAGTNYIDGGVTDPSWIPTINGNVYSFTRTSNLAVGAVYPPIYLFANPPAAGPGLGSALPATVVFGAAEANTANNSISVLTYPAPVAPVTTDISYCQGAAAVPLTATGTNLMWYTVASGGTGSTVAPTPVTTTTGTTTYYVSSSNGTCESTLTPINVTVIAAISNNTIAANQTICAGTTPAALTGSVPAGGSGVYTYSWEQSTNGGTTWAAATGVNNTAGYTPGALTATTLYHRLVTSGVCNVPNISAPVTITVQATVTNNVITAPAITGLCASGDPAIITGNTPAGGSGTFTYQWQSSTDNITFTNIALATSASYDPGTIAVTTYYRRLASSGACTIAVASNTIAINVFPALTPGSITGNQVFCQSGTPAAFTEATAATGGDLNYTYQWQSSTTSLTAGFANITGATAKTYTPTAAITQTTYYRRVVTSVASNCGPQNSNAVTVTVNPVITGNTLTPPASTSICVTGQPGVITGSVPAGGAGTYTYAWDQSTNGGTTWTAVAGAAAKDFTPPVISQTTQYRRRVTSATCTDISTPVTFTVYQQPTTAAAGPNIQQCNVTAFTMAANTPVIGIGTWSVISGNAVIANTASPTTGVTLPAGQSAVLAWTISNGSCTSSASQVTITNYTLPTTANAGADITQYNSGVFTLQGNAPVAGTGLWSVKAGSVAALTNPTSANATATIAANTTATLVWTITNGNCAVSTDEVVIAYTRSADIKVVKSVVTPGPLVAGQNIVYRIITSNAGPSDATGLNILDNVPVGITVSTVNTSVTGAASVTQNTSSGNAINVTANIASGAANTVTVTVNGVISPAFSGTLTNTATVTSPNVPDPDGATSTVTSPVVRTPILNLVKTGPANSIAGSPIAYQITVSNTGLGNAVGTAIKDAIPAQVINTTWTLAKTGTAVINGAVSGTGNNISFTGDIPAGAGNTIVINVTGTVSPSATGSFVNTATATPAEPVPAVNSNSVTTNISSQSGLVMMKNGPAAAQAGTAVSYTLKVTNTGLSDAMNAVIADIVPAEIKNVTWTATAQSAAAIIGAATGAGNLISLKGNIPTGSTNAINVTINGTVDPSFAGTSTNTATATPSEAGSLPSSSTVNTTVSRTPVVTISKTGPATLIAGDNITYIITVNNSGVADAKALVIADQVPASITNVSWSASAGGAAVINGTTSGTTNAISVNADLPAGASNSVTVTVTGKEASSFGGTLTNTATATPAEPGTVAKTASSTATVNKIPVLSIQETGPPSLSAGQQINYTVVISNTGISDADNAIINDLLPANITNVSWSAVASGNASINGTASGTTNAIGLNVNIPVGAANTITLTIQGTVSPSTTADLVNTVTVTPSETGTVSKNAAVTTAINDIPTINLVKTGPSTAVAGQTVTYTVAATNSGPSDASNLNISDNVPAELTNVSWTAASSGTASLLTGASGTGNTVQVTGNIAAGTANQILITMTGQLPSSAAAATLQNTAVATPSETGVPPVNSNTISTVINKTVNITAVKSAPATLSAGQNITYTLNVTNSGPSDAQNLLITDQLPAGINNISWTATGNGAATVVSGVSGTGSAVSLSANIPSGTGNSILVTVTGMVDPGFTGTQLANSFTAMPSEPGNAAVTSNTAITAINNNPALQIHETGPATALAGQTITYTLAVTNTGPSNATGIQLKDVIPAQLGNVSWTSVTSGGAVISTGQSGTGNTIAQMINLPVNGTLLITVTGTVDPVFAGVFTNQATLTPSDPVQPVISSNIVNTTVTNQPGLSISKTGPGTIIAGQSIQYQIKAVNNGPGTAQNAVISDVIQAALTNVSWTATTTGAAVVSAGQNGTGNNLSVTATIPAGAAVTVDITGTVNPGYTGQLTNIATITPTEPGVAAVAAPAVLTTVSDVPGITLVKSGPSDVAAGQTVTYTVTATNQGVSNAANLGILDNVPAGLTNVSWTAVSSGTASVLAGASGTGNTVQVTGNIASGTGNQILITITGQVPSSAASGTLQNVAVATPTEAGIAPVNSNTVSTMINKTVSITAVKSAPATLLAGQNITYTLNVTNNGPSDAQNLLIADQLPAGIINISWTATGNGAATVIAGESGTGSALSLRANVPSGTANSISVTVTGVVDPGFTGTQLVNSFTATPSEPGNAAVISNKTITAISNNAALQIQKTGPATALAGQMITYTLAVTNTGPSNAAGVQLKDMVPAKLSNVSWTSSVSGGSVIAAGQSGTGNTVALTANVAANSTILVTVTGTVDPTFAGVLTNQAILTPADPSQPFINSNIINTTVSNQPDLSISKTGPGVVVAGQLIQYQINAVNNGPGTAQNAVISDVIQAALTNVSWTATAAGTATVSAGQNGTGNNLGVTATIPAGAAVTIDVTGTVDPAYTGQLNNIAAITPAEAGVAPVVTPAVITAVTNVPGITVVKTGPPAVAAGQTVTYTVTATNNGVSDAANLGIVDNVPTGLTNVTWTAVSSGTASVLAGNSGTGNMVQVRGDIAAGTGNQILITITGQVPSSAAAGTLQNVAVAIPTEAGVSPVNSNTVSTIINKNLNITAVKSAPAALSAGQNITYTLNVTNNGPSDAQNLQIADQLPAGINNISWTATGNGAATLLSGASGTGNTVSLFANIPSGTANSIQVTITGTVDPGFTGTQLVNSFTATPSEPGSTAVTSNTTITAISNNTGLTLVKTGPATISSGQNITYTLAVNNAGPSSAVGLLLKDLVPAQLSNVSWTSAASGGAVISTGQSGTGSTVSLTADIPVNGTLLVTVTGTVDPVFAGVLTNQATLTSSNPSQPVISSNIINTTVSNQPGLSIVKTGAATISAGQLMKYQIKVINNSTSTAQNAVISDVIQSALTNVSWAATAAGTATVSAGQTGTGNNLSVTATIPANVTITIDITGTVNPGYTGQLSNIATVTPSEPGATPIVTPPVLTAVSNMPGVTVVKSGPAELKSGEAISYTIELTNTGLSDAANLTLADLISSDISNVKWTAVTAGNATILTGQSGTGNTIGLTGNLPAGAGNKITLTVTGLVSKSFTGKILNTAKVILPGAADVSSNTVETVVDIADFVIPNIITPNGDGENDVFKIKGLENYPGTQVLIFNRWGNEVYKSADYRNDWDGSQLNEGTYYYLVKRRDKQGNVVTFKGWLFIKR